MLGGVESYRDTDKARTVFYVTDDLIRNCDGQFIADLFGRALLSHFDGRSIEDLLTTLSKDQLLEVSQCVIDELDRREM